MLGQSFRIPVCSAARAALEEDGQSESETEIRDVAAHAKVARETEHDGASQDCAESDPQCPQHAVRSGHRLTVQARISKKTQVEPDTYRSVRGGGEQAAETHADHASRINSHALELTS